MARRSPTVRLDRCGCVSTACSPLRRATAPEPARAATLGRHPHRAYYAALAPAIVRAEGELPTKTNPEVERWFKEKKPPTEATMRQVREIIVGADRRMTEFVKYGTLTLGYDGDFATFVQVSDKKQASVMFNRGARIPGTFPHLEGSHPSA